MRAGPAGCPCRGVFCLDRGSGRGKKRQIVTFLCQAIYRFICCIVRFKISTVPGEDNISPAFGGGKGAHIRKIDLFTI